MPLPPDFRFSQSSLQDVVECARRFELRYIDQLRWPAIEVEPVLQRERRAKLGADFHHLLHQHLLGIPAQKLTETLPDDGDLQRWWANYQNDAFIAHLPQFRQPELTLSTSVAGHRLLAKYDLLAIQPNQRAVIVDWKTSPQKPPRIRLEAHLQTVVYRYVLVEAGAHLNGGQPIDPAQVDMVYWFAENPAQPETFRYTAEQHQKAKELLISLIEDVKNRSVFDVTSDARRCRFCVYRSLCERGIAAGNEDDLELDNMDGDFIDDADFDLDEIAEIEF